MTSQLLEKALSELTKLPKEEQDAIAALILNRLAQNGQDNSSGHGGFIIWF